jgi:hypothetical protein
MRSLEGTRQALDLDAYKMRAAEDADIGTLVSESTVLTIGGRIAAVYVNMSEDLENVRKAFERIRYVDDYRTAGLKTNSRTIGFLPRNTLRRDFCTVTGAASEHPAEHAVACSLADTVDGYYARWNPEQHAAHLSLATTKFLPEYRLGKTPFTSGIINDNNPLKYHFDSGNLKGAWSGMVGFKRGIEGGHLATPELLGPDGRALGWEISDRSLILFDGQGVLHGVTPIRKTRLDAHRFTVVFYSLRQIWNCRPLGEELARIRRLRTEREQKRAKGGHNPKAPRG